MGIKPSDMNFPLVDLYETDFYAWTQRQVELLRKRDLNNLDIENLIEEIDSLGKQEKQELVNGLGILLGHLLKWEYQSSRRSRSWVATIREQRYRVLKLLEENPSLTPYLPEATAQAYQSGLALAVKETDMPFKTFSASNSYTWEQIEKPDFLPVIQLDSDEELLN